MTTVRFRLFGFPVQVLPGFWLLLMLLGMWRGGDSVQGGLLVAVVAFASILVHELGHAAVAHRFGMRPQIALHMMGGATLFAPSTTLSRGRDIAVSVAGPLAGLGFGALAYFLASIYGPSAGVEIKSPFVQVLWLAVELNIVWSVLNLFPVIPFDGGRILMAALGPKRRKLAAGASLGFGLLAAAASMKVHAFFPAVLFFSSALSSYMRIRQSEQVTARPVVNQESLGAAVKAARQALDSEAFDQASTLAQGVLRSSAEPRFRKEAMEILLWARLGAKDPHGARALVLNTDIQLLDPYVVAAVHEASGHLDDAQRALVGARSCGDQRVEVTALLVKVLLKLERFTSAAKLTREIITRISADDVRQVAEQARGGGAEGEAAELNLELARVEHSFADARQALLDFASIGALQGAREAFKLAEAFDKQKSAALLNDARLAELRQSLQAGSAS